MIDHIHGFLMVLALVGQFTSVDWTDPKTIAITAQNGLDWVEGFADGFTAENNLTDTKRCILDAEHLTPDIEKLVKDYNAGKKVQVTIDMAKLGVEIPKDVNDCLKIKKSSDGPRLEAFVMQFIDDPSKLESIVLANILANYQKIFDLLTAVVADANAGQWKQSGHDGAKVVPLSFGPVPPASSVNYFKNWPRLDWVLHADHPYLNWILEQEHPLRILLEILMEWF